jgi:hypothetical protein
VRGPDARGLGARHPALSRVRPLVPWRLLRLARRQLPCRRPCCRACAPRRAVHAVDVRPAARPRARRDRGEPPSTTRSSCAPTRRRRSRGREPRRPGPVLAQDVLRAGVGAAASSAPACGAREIEERPAGRPRAGHWLRDGAPAGPRRRPTTCRSSWWAAASRASAAWARPRGRPRRAVELETRSAARPAAGERGLRAPWGAHYVPVPTKEERCPLRSARGGGDHRLRREGARAAHPTPLPRAEGGCS